MKNRISFAIFLLLFNLCSWAQIGGDYNPANPSDPGNPTQEYTLTLKATPTDGGSFNFTSTNLASGSTYTLRAYPSTDYAFVAWLCNGDTLSTSSTYTYTMPQHDVEITGVFTYSPGSPADPQQQPLSYTLTLNAQPTNGGSFNTTSTKVAVGEKYNLRAYPNTDFVFVAWLCQGDTLSKYASFDYTMPSHNVDITGVFAYDPSGPADPQDVALKYQLSLTAKPTSGGSFNLSNDRLAVGSNNSLYAYTNTDFVFKRWMIGDSVLSTNPNMNFVMPAHPVQIVGEFEYNPTSPANPNSNYWNKETGEVIVDDFTPGYLYSAISAAISGSKNSDVTMITVAGKMTNNDFGIANNYSSCTLLDLSRVTGVTEVPSYAFDYTSLESVSLPATIEKIGYEAFYGCQQLSSLTIYAMTPPTLESYVFANVPEGLVVYVPAAAISQYQDAEVWKEFTILPIQEDIRSITISLPEGTHAADYTQMWLELTNTKSGQRLHYVMTDRMQYTFANIIRNTSWSVTLRNERGDVYGQIDNIEVKDEDVSVAFSSLSKPQNVSLAVKTPEGQDVTDQTQITWTDAAGNYIAQGASLTGLPAGYQTNYRVTLSQELVMQYVIPQAADYTLTDGGNTLTCQLQPIMQVQLTGKVKDAATGLPLGDAVVSASQTFGGKYSKTLTAKTDNKGVFTMQVYNVPTSVAFAAADYVSKTIVCDSLMKGNALVTLDDMALRSITGATITLGFTYTSVEGETQNWYSDYQNISYEVFNVTKNRAISQFNEQYPQIVLLEEVEDGDVLRLTATSRTHAFKAVETTATIADQKAAATLAITELGRILATFDNTGNASVVGSLYDASGKLVKTYDYSDAKLTISNLADGQYSLLTMGSSRLFNTIYDLAQLPQTGLVSGTDYVLNPVEVNSGAISQINIDEVPTFDESKLYYTGENTSFTVNKPSIVAGNYLTLTGRIDFKKAYASSVSNVQMIVDLPESCEFVENSVMVGNSTSSYTLNGHQITIPLTHYTDRVRFCVIPTLGGEYAPNAFVQFDLDNKTVTQPIGSVTYTAKDLSISVPSFIAKPSVPVSGTAVGLCDVEIYDGELLIGQTKSLSNGLWATTCQLDNPYNLSTHNIFAKVTTKQGIELQSEILECTYDMNAIQVQKVTMYHDNPEQHKTYEVVFDFQNPSKKADTYVYYIYNKEFTFIIDFNNNDPEKVSNVVLYVKTGNDGKWVPLKPTYDAKKDKWVASGQFGNMYDGNIPVNVKVSYEVNSEPVLEARLSDDLLGLKDGIQEILSEEDADLNDVIARYDAAVEAENEELADELLQQMMALMGIGEVNVDEALMNETELNQLAQQMQQENELAAAAINNFSSQSIYLKDVVKEYMKDVTIEHAPAMTPEQLIANGYEAVKKSDNSFYYVLLADDGIHYVDFAADVHLIMTGEIVNASRRASDDSGDQWLEKVHDLCMKAENVLTTIMGTFDDCVERIGDAIAKNETLLAEARKALANKKKLKLSKSEVKELQKSISNYTKSISKYKKLNKVLNKKVRPFLGSSKDNFGKIAGKGFTLFAIAVDSWECYEKLSKLNSLKKSITAPCEEAKDAAASLKSDVNGWMWKAGAFYTYKIGCNIAELAGFSGGLLGLIPSGGSSLTAILAAAAVMAANIAADMFFDWRYKKNYSRFCEEYRDLYKICKKEPCDGKKPCPPGSEEEEGDGSNAQDSGNTDCNPQIDPSGYVYEGVFSNRVEGATATVFYKEMVEDMYGDLHENIVKWDAEEYAQENPLFTDENGYYRWDVPNGLWQVKFEKEGYETTYSEWLPVPPPQLDVNIAMKQNVQPSVRAARAFEDAVELEFDKYMMPELLTAENISVIQAGKAVEGSVKLLDAEAAYEGSQQSFASKIRFNASQAFSEKEITLLVSNRVKSYAGIRMQDDYQQVFTIEPEIKEIVSDSLKVLNYGEKTTLTVSVLPAAASQGKTLSIATSSPMILGVETQQVTIGNDGKAEITVSGELPGVAALTFSVEGTDKTGTTIANVGVQKVTDAPQASIASGSKVDKGTQVTLTCKTSNATIYYTIDGSCPCEESTRKTYDGTPIIINKSTVIKAMAVAPDLEDSEIVRFMYVVTLGDVNGDGSVTITDAVGIVNKILGNPSANFIDSAADVNGDGNITITDAVGVVNMILNQGAN